MVKRGSNNSLSASEYSWLQRSCVLCQENCCCSTKVGGSDKQSETETEAVRDNVAATATPCLCIEATNPHLTLYSTVCPIISETMRVACVKYQLVFKLKIT